MNKMNKLAQSSHSHSHSSHRSKSQPRSSPSPKPQPRPQSLNESSIFSQLKSQRQKVSSSLDAHLLVFSSGAIMRCFQHDSPFSLYCSNDHIPLCANCIFKAGTHRLHKVSPLQKSYESIYKDVIESNKQMQKLQKWIQTYQKSTHKLIEGEQRFVYEAICGIVKEYDNLHMQLVKSQEQAKRRLAEFLDSILKQKEQNIMEMQMCNEMLIKFKPVIQHDERGAYEEYKNKNQLIFDHVCSGLITNFSKVFEKVPTVANVTKLRDTYKRQLGKIGDIIQIIERWDTYYQNSVDKKKVK